jgi:hypothetical protein
VATDWGLEVFKIVGTGVSVFIGAKLAWDNASKGRKEEVLVKERYKAFENIIGILYELEYHLFHINGLFDVTPLEDSYILDDEFDWRLEKINETYDFYGKMITYRQFIMFNSEKVSKIYNEILKDLPYLKREAEDYLYRISTKERSALEITPMSRLESINSIHGKADKLRDRTRELINTIFGEQGFPTQERPFRNTAKISIPNDS